MDLAVTLVKSVMRAFYATREILVIDALILHEALRDDDLAYLMSINTKDLHKICGKLREDRFLTVHTRSELRAGESRPRNRTWYYINYRQTIDAVKWRMSTINTEVQGTTLPVNEKKQWFCSFCSAEWTEMEVLDNVGPEGFLCHRCRHVLTFEEDRNSGGHEQSTRLNNQLKFIADLLQKIDSARVPECDFERALAKARPVIRDATHQRQETVAVDSGASRPAAVRGLTNVGPQSIEVNISTTEGASEAAKEAERANKEALAKQNALPSWMANSTVTGDSFSRTTDMSPVVHSSSKLSHTEDNGVPDTKANAQIGDIFEKLKAEQLATADDDDDEEEGEYESEADESFEDVPPTGTATPAEGATGFASSVNSIDTSKLRPEDAAEDSVEDEEDEDMEFEDV